MKNIFLKFSFSLFTVFLLFSCKTNKVKNEENLVNFAHLTLDSLAHLDNDTAKQSCKITLNLEYPVDADNKVLLDTLIYDFVETIFGNQYTGKSFEDAAKAYIKTYI